jgi:copper(I)-binding protein
MQKIYLMMLCIVFAGAAHAADATITVHDAWLRASLGQSPNTAGYMKIENRGATEDRLVSVAVAGANMAHVHESVMKDGVMQMKAVDALSVKPGEAVEFKPGGLHVMVMGLKTPLKAGETVQLRLQFARAGEITVNAQVRGLSGTP